MNTADVAWVSRTVEITITYTKEEFYFVSPFQVGNETEEGPIWASVLNNMTTNQP